MLSGSSIDNANFLPLQLITLPPQQPRRYFDPEAMLSLVNSIQEHGILEPILVRFRPDQNYELVAGERRLRAAHAAGLSEIPVVIKELDDQEALKISILENLLREDLNPVEETEGILKLLELHLVFPAEQIISLLYKMQNDAHRLTHNVMGQPESQIVLRVFHEIGMSWESFVNNRLPLLKLPDDVLTALRQGRLAYTKAIAIAKVKDIEKRQQLLDEVLLEQLSLSEIRQRIAQILANSNHGSASTEGVQPQSLKQLFDSTYRFIQKTNVWNNPEKRSQLEHLLNQLKALALEG
jgi:ParB family transcriptional regulator, chromosome partitioning protein